MVVTQRNPPQTNLRKNKAHTRPIKNVRNSQAKPKDTFDCKTEDITGPGEFINGNYVETSPISSPSRNYQPQQEQQSNKKKPNVSPVRPSLHTNSSPIVNNMVPFTNMYYNTPSPVHYRNYSTPTMYPVTAPPTVPIPTSLAKPIPFPTMVEEPKALLVPAKLANKSSPSIPVPIGAFPTQKATKPGYFSVDELEQNNSSPKRSEYELGTSPGTSPPISSSAPKRLQNAVVKPANSRYYSDGNYANAPHPSDLPRPKF